MNSLLSLSAVLVRNLLLIAQRDGRPMLSNEPQTLKPADPCYCSPFSFIYIISKNSPAVGPWGDADGKCLFVVTDQRRPSCVMCCWG